ncbi:hypothetical protein KDU71_07370 [Carboxylicivirga sediminis]|uniref:Uncharacterized protein n=1 Tax=Carboxylicivirga sediminis TaxID=2006564 RepID=A0A941F480_9BACT|nr:hypothetical protein [Carboxylicivirga sediminis]MBR8535375.1 hypothetical protein [Carboxylicivirga sediminis]
MLSWINSLEKFGVPVGLVRALFFIMTGALITIPSMKVWSTFTGLDARDDKFDHSIQQLDSTMTKISDNQDIILLFMLEASKSQEFTTNSMVEMMQELGREKPDALRVIIEKKKAVDQYQKDHLPHYKKRVFIQSEHRIVSEEITD